MIKKFLVNPGGNRVSLKEYRPNDTAGLSYKDIKKEYTKLKKDLVELQEVLFASKKYAMLIVLQGMDCSGKDGTVKKVLADTNPNGVNIASFKEPTPVELGHDYLWRTHSQAPMKGDITVFNRSYYEDVLVTRVHGMIDDEKAFQRFDEINEFEKYLVHNRTVVLKFFLHISKKFQQNKLEDRLETPDKLWKFSEADLKERKFWERYQECYSDMLSHCSTKEAPWYIVPANHRWFRDYFILKVIVKTLEGLNLEYPKPNENIQALIREVEDGA